MHVKETQYLSKYQNTLIQRPSAYLIRNMLVRVIY